MSKPREEMTFVNVFHGVTAVSDFARGKQKMATVCRRHTAALALTFG